MFSLFVCDAGVILTSLILLLLKLARLLLGQRLSHVIAKFGC